MSQKKPIHLYLSRYKEHLAYLRETGQETSSWKEIRDEDLPAFLTITDSDIEWQTDMLVRDYAEDGNWKSGDMLHMNITLKDGTKYSIHGYYIEEKKDWFPNENPVIHKSSSCGFCQSIIGFGKDKELKQEFCMLPLPEKKYLFEEVLKRHEAEMYKV